MFGANAASYDKTQKIRASLVTKPASTNNPIEVDIKTKSGKQIKFDQQVEMPNSYVVRVTFQRLVWNQKGIMTKIEGINEPEIYQEFFDKLSKSIFLQAQNVN
jgi:spore germination protein YaaH